MISLNSLVNYLIPHLIISFLFGINSGFKLLQHRLSTDENLDPHCFKSMLVQRILQHISPDEATIDWYNGISRCELSQMPCKCSVETIVMICRFMPSVIY